MVAWFKCKTTIATYALFSGIVMTLMVVTSCMKENSTKYFNLTLPTSITTKAWSSVKPSSKKYLNNGTDAKKEHISTFMIVVSCIAAALVPFIIFCIIYFVAKLIRYERKERKETNTNVLPTETTSINVQSQIYTDSIGNSYDASAAALIAVPSNNTLPTLPVPKRKKYEIKRELIKNLQIVGQGAFGLVAKADLYAETTGSNKRTVAVKMLKVFSSIEDKHDLISELNLMQGIDPHQNVVELLGCVTETDPIWVITRYAARGDLLGFLRKSRGINDTTYRDLAKKPKTNLCPKQLLQMAKDIACGMTHLSENKILHRDLAAINVLVDENMKCKITDFGMLRDVKSTNYYRTRNRGRIPLKWTAIEALLYDKCTTKSDVWSYGIVLYEIVTIGGSPYPNMGPCEILRKLKNEWRMEKPCHVNDQLYDIMKDCWVFNPDDRPTFSELSKKFSMLLGARSHDYINMKEYNEVLHGLIESTSESSSGSTHEVFV